MPGPFQSPGAAGSTHRFSSRSSARRIQVGTWLSIALPAVVVFLPPPPAVEGPVHDAAPLPLPELGDARRSPPRRRAARCQGRLSRGFLLVSDQVVRPCT